MPTNTCSVISLWLSSFRHRSHGTFVATLIRVLLLLQKPQLRRPIFFQPSVRCSLFPHQAPAMSQRLYPLQQLPLRPSEVRVRHRCLPSPYRLRCYLLTFYSLTTNPQSHFFSLHAYFKKKKSLTPLTHRLRITNSHKAWNHLQPLKQDFSLWGVVCVE